MTDLTKLPLSITSFSEFAANSMIYVDKTDLVANLARFRNPFFLSRPRRFGKSTLVSTFHELFSNGLDKFQGLKIVTDNLWNDKTYKVIHLDLSKIKEQSGDITFNESFLQQLDDAFSHGGYEKILNEEIKTPARYLDTRFNQKDIDSLVLLIDEYDAPLTAVMGDKEEFELRRRVLSNFFSTIKAYSGKFRFIFITGITRYKDAYLLTAGNAILDISQDPTFSEICGYTRSEIKTYFKDHLCFAAAQIYKLPANKIDPLKIDEFLDKLALWYDGYYFDACCSTKIFSLWSILNFFSSKNAIFDTYWYDSAGETTLLRKVFFKEDYFKILKLFENNQSVLVDLTKFKTPSPLPYMDPFVLLYQLGYLTLAKPYLGLEAEPFTLDVELKFPNLEIENSFTKLLINNLPSYDPTLAQILKNCAKNLKEAINKQDLTSFVHELNRCFNHIPYDGQVIDNEALVNYLMGLFLIIILRKNVENNRHEASGRPDLIFNCENTTVVIENKFIADDNKKTSQKALLSAGKQILEHDYGNTLLRHEKLWRIALVFSGKKRQIIAFKDADLS